MNHMHESESLWLFSIKCFLRCFRIQSVVFLVTCIVKGVLCPLKKCTMCCDTYRKDEAELPDRRTEALTMKYSATLMAHYFSSIAITATLAS